MNKIFLIIATFSVCGSAQAYQQFDAKEWSDNYLEKFHRDFDRAENRRYQQDMIRLQEESNRINSSLQRQRGYQYGR